MLTDMWRGAGRDWRCGGGTVALGFLALLSGCTRKAEFTLRQPFAPPAQQNLKLLSDSSFCALEGERATYAFSFPLPGSEAGPRAFVVYLTAPPRPAKVAADPADPLGVRGFLIQEVGALAGRCDFVHGTLEVRSVPMAPRFRRLSLRLQTEDGAELVGHAVVENLPRAVQTMEREFPADVASVLPTQPEEEPEGPAESVAADSPAEPTPRP